MKYCIALLFSCLAIAALAQTKDENTLIQKTTAFYKWYKSNEEKMNRFKLVQGKGNNQEPPFAINWTEVNRYFTYIRQSVPALGEAFIAWHKKDFKELDQFYKDNPDEEIPAGFDYERIVGGQEQVAYVLATAFPTDGKWQVRIQGNTAMVSWVYKAINVETNQEEEQATQTEFKKEKGVWKIARTMGMIEVDSFKAKDKVQGNSI